MQPFKPQSESALENAPHGHEEGEVAVNGILVFLSVLAASCLVVFVVCFFLRAALINWYLPLTDSKPNHWQKLENDQMKAQRAEELKRLPAGKPIPNEDGLTQREMSQIVEGRNKDDKNGGFPQPRLQTDSGDGADDLQAMRKHEDEMLGSYMWVDKSAGRVTIPIEDAMQAVVAKKIVPSAQESPAPAVTAAPTP